MQLISSTGGSIGRFRSRPRLPQVLSVTIAALCVVFGLVSPASAQAAPVPRLLPTAVPAGYSVNDSFDRVGPRSDVQFVQILRDDAKTHEFYINSTPIEKARFTESVIPSRLDAGAKKVKVRGTTGTVQSQDADVRVDWFERNRWITVISTNVTPKATLAFVANVVPTKAPDASFVVKKIPAGYASIYAGQSAGLTSSVSGVLWTNADSEEIELFIANVVPNYLEIGYLGVGSGYTPTTVNGKPGYIAQRTGGTTVVWMEQPNLLIELRSTQFNEAGIDAIAASLAPVEEAAWVTATTAVDPSKKPVDGSGGGTLPPANSAPVAAGTLNGVPWVATANGNCLVFAAGTASSQACIPGFTSPTALAWNTLVASGKTFAVGITGANVATVVGKANGAEVTRIATQPVVGQPGLKYFIVELSNATGVTFSGLDAAGAEIAPGVAPAPAVPKP
jgi:hypothetical protein